jgi:hypothetical protein
MLEERVLAIMGPVAVEGLASLPEVGLVVNILP